MRNVDNRILYAVTVLVWGSTWFAITFQKGVVAPEVSIAYRFGLATVLLLGYCVVRGLTLRFDWRAHLFIALQGFLLFSLNYYLLYVATFTLTSGLIAIVFSTIAITNSLFGALFLRNPIRPRVLLGALVGLSGLALVFWRELVKFDLSTAASVGLVLSLAGSLSASLGNIVSARNQRDGLPVVQTNALGMGYGTLFTLLIVLVSGSALNFDGRASYVVSMIYLALFGSIVGFSSYLTLLGRIGPDRSAYATVLFPVVAMILSTLFEGFEWTSLALAGVALVLIGNAIVLTKVRPGRLRADARQTP